jgi:hypothetical protein
MLCHITLLLSDPMQDAPGRVSFTTDIWTDFALHPFMSITAHFIKDSKSKLTLEARLICFKYMPGSHDGASLGKAFVEILRKYGLTEKVGQITSDNASNNHSMTKEIEAILRAEGIYFSSFGSHIR